MGIHLTNHRRPPKLPNQPGSPNQQEMSSLKLFGQVILLGARVAGRFIRESYREAMASLAKNAMGTNAVAKSSGKMDLDEAYKILNVSKDTPYEELVQKYERVFQLNDKSKGGSFYLQSKIVRARERIEADRTY